MSDTYQIQFHKYANTSDSYFSRRVTGKSNENNPRYQQRVLNEFKELIGSSLNLALKDKSCLNDDQFLKRFLYARKFHSANALNLLINYFNFKSSNKDFLRKINIFDEYIRLALLDGNPGILKERDRKGRKVITFTASNWDPNKYSIEAIYRALLLSLDKLLENIETQALGIVVIVDWTNFTLKKASCLSPKILKLMVHGLQDCMPVKFKGIHYIAPAWHVELSQCIMKPFFNEKTKKRLMVHGTNLSTLHGLISKDILPPDLGGEGPTINTMDWYHHLLESSQINESPKSYRLIETAVYTKVP